LGSKADIVKGKILFKIFITD